MLHPAFHRMCRWFAFSMLHPWMWSAFRRFRAHRSVSLLCVWHLNEVVDSSVETSERVPDMRTTFFCEQRNAPITGKC